MTAGDTPVVNNTSSVMDLLADGVPVTLLLDLVAPDGPSSHRLLVEESADLSWCQAHD